MKAAFLFCLIALASCKNISTRENNQEDIQNASKLMDQFYADVKSKNFDKAVSLCGGELTLTIKDDILIKIDSVWGGLNQYKLIEAKTVVTTTNGKTEGEYNLKFKVEYEKSPNNEENVFIRIINDSLKITGYHSVQLLN